MAAIAAAVFVIDFPLRLSFLNATGRQVFQKSGHGEERRNASFLAPPEKCPRCSSSNMTSMEVWAARRPPLGLWTR
jgi:hypothetical protein